MKALEEAANRPREAGAWILSGSVHCAEVLLQGYCKGDRMGVPMALCGISICFDMRGSVLETGLHMAGYWLYIYREGITMCVAASGRECEQVVLRTCSPMGYPNRKR